MGADKKNLCKRICEYIWKRDSKELSGITVSSISDKFRIKREKLLKKFKGTLGISFFDFIDFVRLRRAETLLKSRSDLSVTEISLMVGMKKRQNFSEKFKKKYGLTPNEFRKLHK